MQILIFLPLCSAKGGLQYYVTQGLSLSVQDRRIAELQGFHEWYEQDLFPWSPIAAAFFWKLDSTYLFITFAHQIAAFMIKLPQGTSSKSESSVKVHKTQ